MDDLIPVNGKRIRAYRRKMAWTQVELAKRAGVSRSYVSEIEQGVKTPRHLYAKALAGALKVTVEDLIGSSQLPASAGPTPRPRA